MRKNSHPWAKWRRAAGLTQAQVAERLNVTRHYIIRLEQSLFWHPPDSLMARLAALYQIELGTFEMGYYRIYAIAGRNSLRRTLALRISSLT